MNRKLFIADVRRHMAALGFPLDEYTDDEIEAGIIPLGRLTATALYTAQESAEVMAEANQLFHGLLPSATDLPEPVGTSGRK